MKKFIVSSLLFVLIIVFNVNVTNAEENNMNYILLDSETMEEIGSISNYLFENGELYFICNGEEYNFSLQKIAEENGVNIYSGSNNNICCNLAQSGKDVSIQVINKDIYPAYRNVGNKNFTIIITEKGKQSLLNDIENNNELKRIKEDNKKVLDESQAINNGLARGRAHVLKSVAGGGVSEGWADYTGIEPGYYMVSKITYNVAYRYASDGISLWYKRDANTHLFRTPVNCPAGVRSVSGSWKVKHGSSTFMAEITGIITVNNIPIMSTYVDTYYF